MLVAVESFVVKLIWRCVEMVGRFYSRGTLEGYFVGLGFGGHRIMTSSCESSTKEISNLEPEDA